MKILRYVLPLVAILVVAFGVLSAAGGGYEYSLLVRNQFTNYGSTILDIQTITRTANLSGASLNLPAYATGITCTDSITIDSITAGASGQIIYFVSPDSDLAIADGKNLQLNSSFAGTTGDVITLVYYGAKWKEVSRSAN
jgi:hypothetical protein